MRISKPVALIVTTLAITLLSACGGSSSDSDGGTGQVRLINATPDYESLDLYVADTRVSTAVGQDSAGTYVALGAATSTFKLKRTDTTITSLAVDRTINSGVNNTLVAYTTNGNLRTAYMTDNEAAPTAGYAKLRVFNTSYEAGSVDAYVTSVGGSLDGLSPFGSTLAGERFSAYTEVAAGSYRLVVTANGDKTDLRLDIPNITLANQQVTTLILTTTPGGVLLHGLLVDQAGTPAAYKNLSARIRLMAGTTANGTVSASLNGVTLATGLRSPTLGAYTLVPAGALSSSVTVDGSPLATSGLTAAPGADLTLMVLGTPAAAQATLLADDNKPPLTSTYAKLRLVHGVNGLASAITLSADYSAIATDVLFANASTGVQIPAGTSYRLEANSPLSATPLYLATEVALQATHVYTAFLLGDATAPLGVLRRDR
ncbi:DUF4397 domain-containing protein [Sphaerotilaceae bacterium SBD11-9]